MFVGIHKFCLDTKRLFHLSLYMCFCLAALSASAQLNFDFQEGKILIKGTVVDAVSKKALPLANIRNLNSGKAYSSNSEGQFTLYVGPNDTLRFTSVGYLGKNIHIADIEKSKYYTLVIELYTDAIRIKEVVIYPFRNRDEFVDAFMDAKEVNKVLLPGIEKPKYSNATPKAKLTNPVSFIYERMRKKRAADPDFKP